GENAAAESAAALDETMVVDAIRGDASGEPQRQADLPFPPRMPTAAALVEAAERAAARRRWWIGRIAAGMLLALTAGAIVVAVNHRSPSPRLARNVPPVLVTPTTQPRQPTFI